MSGVDVGRFGIWTSALDRQPATIVRQAVAKIERLGFGALWVGEAARREVFANTSLLLSATQQLVVASGIANIWARDATAMAAGQRTLSEAWDSRFLLGLGVSHDRLVDPRGHRYERPLTAMRRYLDAMDRAPYLAPMPDPVAMTRVLGALGPRMLALAGEVTDGAHPYLVPVEHTEQARAILGPTKLLCPEVAVVVIPDPEAARRVARAHLATYLQLANYRGNLARLGFGDHDLTGGGSDRLVDALVAWGPAERVVRRVHEHLDAGADHVAIQVLTADPARVPLEEWTDLAAALRLDPRSGPALTET
ncbi:MAG: TIGR03620 family F420-dependent LLM class oxidoreductase [Acidimicrobiales bacterium]